MRETWFMGGKKMKQNVASKKREITAKRIIKAVEKAHGLVGLAADMAGIHRNTVSKYIRDFPSVAEAVEDAREKLYDTVESKLYERIEAGDLTAIIFFLKTRCKHRGYTEKQIETPQEMIIKVEYADDIKRDESHNNQS